MKLIKKNVKKFSYISVSLHENPYNWEKLINIWVCQHVDELKSISPTTFINAKIICTNNNILEIENRIRELLKYNFDKVVCQVELSENNDGVKMLKETLNMLLLIENKFSSDPKVIFLYDKVMKFEARRCFSLDNNLSLTVASDGNVYNCLPDVLNDSFSIGNINELSVKDIFDSSRNNDIKDRLQKRYLSKKCNNCRFEDYNSEINKLKREIDALPFKEFL